MKTQVTVIFPFTFDIEFDPKKANDDDYVEAKRNEAKDLADYYLEQGGVKPVIHESSVDALIE